MLFCSDLSEKKRAFLTGTLLLTAAGFLCRLLGFFYRIFLSRTIGAEGLGIYNMVHPVYGICFALCGGSIQTALSQYIAAHESQGRKVFRTGLTISMVLSGILAFLICQYPAWIASHILIEPRCAPYLPIMGLSLPFASFHACANGYCYGAQRSRVPAYSQVAEQVVRMSLVFLIAGKWAAEGTEITVRLAVYGHLIGEIGAASFNLLCLGLFPPQGRNMERAEESSCLMPLMTLALPLMGNRLILNLLAGAEAVWIPNRLQMSGLSDAESFSVYGILTGMALPFILFPSAITNSIAVLLLPSVAKDQAEGRTESISGSVSMAAALQSLHGDPLHRHLCTVRMSTRYQRIQRRTGRTLYADSGMALSLSLSGRHHGQHLKRPGLHPHHLSAKCCRHAPAACLCCSRYPAFRNLRLSLRHADQRDIPGSGTSVVLKAADPFHLECP